MIQWTDNPIDIADAQADLRLAAALIDDLTGRVTYRSAYREPRMFEAIRKMCDYLAVRLGSDFNSLFGDTYAVIETDKPDPSEIWAWLADDIEDALDDAISIVSDKDESDRDLMDFRRAVRAMRRASRKANPANNPSHLNDALKAESEAA